MAKFYQKTHKLKKAANIHGRKITLRGGKVESKVTKLGYKLTYYYPQAALTVKATKVSELITQAGKLGSKTVVVTFKPYGEKAKGKVSYFDVITEASDIIELAKSPDVASIKFKK